MDLALSDHQLNTLIEHEQNYCHGACSWPALCIVASGVYLGHLSPDVPTSVQMKSELSSLVKTKSVQAERIEVKVMSSWGVFLVLCQWTLQWNFSSFNLWVRWWGRVTFRFESHEETHTWETVIHLLFTAFRKTIRTNTCYYLLENQIQKVLEPGFWSPVG